MANIKILEAITVRAEKKIILKMESDQELSDIQMRELQKNWSEKLKGAKVEIDITYPKNEKKGRLGRANKTRLCCWLPSGGVVCEFSVSTYRNDFFADCTDFWYWWLPSDRYIIP